VGLEIVTGTQPEITKWSPGSPVDTKGLIVMYSERGSQYSLTRKFIRKCF
jgi:hypothetical protein